MTMTPHGRSESIRPTRIAVAVRDGAPAWALLDSGDAIAPRPVWGRGSVLRCALVGTRMMLLGGDHLEVRVELGEGCVLELVEPAGVVAHDAGGVPSSISMDVQIGDGATFVYDGSPLIAATGSDVTRSFAATLGRDARVLVRETLVRGRSAETGGRILSRMRVGDARGDLLAEDLELGAGAAALPGILNGVRTIDSVVAVGWEPAGAEGVPAEASLRLDEPGAIVRVLAGEGERLPDAVSRSFDAWRDTLYRVFPN